MHPSAWLSLGRLHPCRACLRFTRKSRLDAHGGPPVGCARHEFGIGELIECVAEPLVVHAESLAQRGAGHRQRTLPQSIEDARVEIGIRATLVDAAAMSAEMNRAAVRHEFESHRLWGSRRTMLDRQHEVIAIASEVCVAVANRVKVRAATQCLPGLRSLLLAGVVNEYDGDIEAAL